MLFEQFKSAFPQLKDKWDEYSTYLHRIEVPAKTVLLREGQISKKAFHIEKGCLRAWINKGGKDITFQFFFEKETISSAESFRKNIPSFVTIESVEPCILHWISKSDLVKIMNEAMEIPEIRASLIDGIFERHFNYTRQLVSFITQNPKERYLKLVKERPHIVLRVPQHYIASYLGITPVSLSRIRNSVS
ncbi:MAG: Crp/Fnr family transcriptional regulator [Bacteroidetes bacterium]|nr:Crp/Fnr family transcriptional regulator [Bacteroidota bacterium]